MHRPVLQICDCSHFNMIFFFLSFLLYSLLDNINLYLIIYLIIYLSVILFAGVDVCKEAVSAAIKWARDGANASLLRLQKAEAANEFAGFVERLIQGT